MISEIIYAGNFKTRFMPDMGQYAVGACLRFNYGCQTVSYNQRFSLRKFDEIGVVGFNPSTNTVFICDVIIQFEGLKIGPDYTATLHTMRNRFKKMKDYGDKIFSTQQKEYLFWSPHVPKGKLMDGLFDLARELGMVMGFKINKHFAREINKLYEKAERTKADLGEPFFKAMQIKAYCALYKE